jgi:F-type H+-transporting ATPase subunit alpha
MKSIAPESGEVPVGDELIGRVVTPLGEPLDGLGPVKTTKTNL